MRLSATALQLAIVLLGAAALMSSCSSGSRTISGADESYGSGNLDSPAAAERHGCCTNGGGACGCSKGKVQCCDGSTANACACE
ncbi:MAG: hypothetical protein HY075_16685 [Deltaproteobacteria bacterium]|nr:hypothetical protein [Deltaproteobacteria bacterium]